MVIETGAIELKAAIVWEYEECECQEAPWFNSSGDYMLIASDTRLFGLDRRLAFR